MPKPATLGFPAFSKACVFDGNVETVPPAKQLFHFRHSFQMTMMNHHGPPIIGCSAAAEKLRGEIDQIARTELSVMIRGERGTGKEVVAKEIRRKSNRAAGPFVPVNCGGVPDDLVESEFFGSAKGGFTGAVDRPGNFELAQDGTIFLDELAELPMKAQATLLRVTENLEVKRVGGRTSIPVNFRLIVATNRNLEEMVRLGTFRDDLYDRLNEFSIWIPPLRERLDDIPLLVDYFVHEFAGQAQRMVNGAKQQVLDLFREYPWPGNVRELRNVVKYAVFTGKSEWIGPEDLSFDFRRKLASPSVTVGNYDERMEQYSYQLVLGALKQCHYNRTKAADLLGLPRSNFYRLLKRHGLDAESSRNGHA